MAFDWRPSMWLFSASAAGAPYATPPATFLARTNPSCWARCGQMRKTGITPPNALSATPMLMDSYGLPPMMWNPSSGIVSQQVEGPSMKPTLRYFGAMQTSVGQDFSATSAQMFKKGEDVDRDLSEAARWYELSAKQGDADAQFSIASMYDQGQGVSQCHELAAMWYQKAAEQGDAAAQTNLGVMYDTGRRRRAESP
jgi:hypothetical protein